MMTRSLICVIRYSRRSRLAHCESGIALLEFAMVLPVLLLLLFGTYEVHRYVTVNQKLETAAFQLLDMVTNTQSISATRLDGLMSSVNVMIAPYTSEDMRVIVTSIRQPDGGSPTTLWQRSLPAGSPGSTVSNGTGMPAHVPLTLVDRDQVITIEILFRYKSVLGLEVSDAFLDSESIYKLAISRPRYGSLVEEP